MSKCPKCGKIYQDQTLFFCLEDGEKLVLHEINYPHPTPTVIVNPNPSPIMPAKEVKSNLSFYLRLVAIGILAFIGAIAGFIFIALQMTPSPNINYSIPNKASKTEDEKPSGITEPPKAISNTDQCEIDSKKYPIDDIITTLTFESESAMLWEESIGNLGTAAEVMKGWSDKCNLEIIVHSKKRRSPSSEKNFAQAKLSKFRAEEIKKWLVKNGIKPERIKTGGQVDYQTTAANSETEGEEDYRIELKVMSSETIQNEPRCSSTVANC